MPLWLDHILFEHPVHLCLDRLLIIIENKVGSSLLFYYDYYNRPGTNIPIFKVIK